MTTHSPYEIKIVSTRHRSYDHADGGGYDNYDTEYVVLFREYEAYRTHSLIEAERFIKRAEYRAKRIVP